MTKYQPPPLTPLEEVKVHLRMCLSDIRDDNFHTLEETKGRDVYRQFCRGPGAHRSSYPAVQIETWLQVARDYKHELIEYLDRTIDELAHRTHDARVSELKRSITSSILKTCDMLGQSRMVADMKEDGAIEWFIDELTTRLGSTTGHGNCQKCRQRKEAFVDSARLVRDELVVHTKRSIDLLSF